METDLARFEIIVRKAVQYSDAEEVYKEQLHPFVQRNIFEGLPSSVRRLFDNAHYAQATFEAYKFIDKKVQELSKASDTGIKLMMHAFAVENPQLKLNALLTPSERDEQKGYQFLFAGAVLAIRNPRGHEYTIVDDLETCLDHLCFASMLMRRLSEAGYK